MSTYFKKGSAGAIIVALIAVILLGLAVWYVASHKTLAPGNVATTTPVAGQQTATYTNDVYGYSVTYPTDLTLVKGVEVPELNAQALGDTLQFPKEAFAGTTISPTQSQIAIVATSTACGSLIPQSTNGDTSTLIINGRTFTRASFGDAGAGHSYQSDAYFTTENGLCYTLVFLTDTVNPGNYGYDQDKVNTITTLNTDTRANLKQEFDQIASTFTITPVKTVTQVQVPLLVDQNNATFSGSNAACDKVTYVTRSVATTTEPLNAVYTALFSKGDPWPYTDSKPGNFVTTQTKLSFDKATLENGVAKVYLKGSTGPLSGECDDTRLKNQLTAAATQFNTVTSVEFYLNNVKTDLAVSEKGE